VASVTGLGSSHDPEETFASVVDGTRRWLADARPKNEGSLGRSLAHHVQGSLNRSVDSRWDRHVVDRRSGRSSADVEVDGVIGVQLFSSLHQSSVAAILKGLRVISRRYSHLLLVGYRLPRGDGDRWRMLKRSISASAVGTERVAVVESFREDAEGDEQGADGGRRDRLRRAADGVAALVGVVLVLVLAGQVWRWAVGVDGEVGVFFLAFGAFYAAVYGLSLFLRRSM
jgi:hypothetical protein